MFLNYSNCPNFDSKNRRDGQDGSTRVLFHAEQLGQELYDLVTLKPEPKLQMTPDDIESVKPKSRHSGPIKANL
jgi:hypothetical protein